MKNKLDIENRIKVGKQLALIALVSISYFVIAIVALHFLRTDHNPIKQTTSQYVGGPWGGIMTSAFFSMSMASFALAIELNRGISSQNISRIGPGLLGAWGVSVLIAMSFPINVDGTPLTTSGLIHRINGPLGFFILTIGTILISRSFRNDKHFRPLHRRTLILSWLMLTILILTLVNAVTESGYSGLGQRILLVIFVIWFCLIAVRLYAIANNQAGPR